MPICVRSEIGKLKKVMLHRPGKELEHLVPGELERLLFDDIPYLKTAQSEHDYFAGLLRANGTEVVYLEDLTADVLRDPAIKDAFVRQIIQEGGSAARQFSQPLYDYLMGIDDEKELVLKTMSGVSMGELKPGLWSPLTDLIKSTSRFVMDPIPNLYFTRDPFASVGHGVSLNRMYSMTRRRETIYASFILEHHPDFAGQVPFYYRRDYPFSIEGGDILNLSPQVLAIGISQRTTPEAIELLARNIFQDPGSEVEVILALDIPNLRTFMHLDTVFTQVDHDKFTIHPAILDVLRIYELRKWDAGEPFRVRELNQPLPEVLAEYLKLDQVTMIRCGGKDRVASEREQWNDGSNTLCIAPGKVVVYDRNYITNAILRENSVEVLEMPSSELSRGRGGPRCMSIPLEREDV